MFMKFLKVDMLVKIIVENKGMTTAFFLFISILNTKTKKNQITRIFLYVYKFFDRATDQVEVYEQVSMVCILQQLHSKVYWPL